MIVGYLVIGTLAGISTFIVALVLGTSFWLALSLYALVGASAVILLVAANLVTHMIVGRAKPSTAADPWTETGHPEAAESATIEQELPVEPALRILAVDDDPFILELIPMISAKVGFSEVTPAESGEHALRLLTQSEKNFDCLLLDISMPDMDGIELCRRVRALPQYRQTPIIMLTAMRDMKNMGEAFRAGATDYATKPFDIDELGQRLRLARETIHAQNRTTAARPEGIEYVSGSESGYHVQLPKGKRPDGAENLVDRTVLSNYLSQLPRKDLTDIQMFAVSIDGLEADQTKDSPPQSVALLKDIATAASDCFGFDRTLMAYTDNTVLLIVTISANMLSAVDLEKSISERLKGSTSALTESDGSAVDVSVGGPLQPHGARAQRATMTTDRVIALAESRVLEKQSRTRTVLSKR